ncbi:MAG: PEFG-CTERM domain-containing protein [Nitrosopumilus sp.]|nr:PEFG-CTERM domain-containing protein [Nitrosopumilus sp.]MDH3490202.1 PEFG-CTERM domain-containing protein [Nitrosopumilus sp.]MDH3516941.1 PEFG-CTERM domain-containing protein [Nitrosopumilus sp.]MDH3565316.1 PEFG-CTERM domain-containing protein [Nitrosopumilus sp.]MDH5417024.1 PEFG-CTERM domain-containing protein [Nitrosopumilus sp.]
MLKIPFLMLIAVSIFSSSAFAESTIEVSVSEENIKSLDAVLITGKITEVSQYKPVKLTVTDPEGIVVYSPLVTIKDDGSFRKIIQPTLPSFKDGTYSITASHEETQVIAKTQFTVTQDGIPRSIIQPTQEPKIVENGSSPKTGITLEADAVNGSDTIKIKGNTSYRGTDITFIVNSPAGNLISIGQITPGIHGDFELEIKAGGSLWKEDGIYTITANQGTSSEYKKSIQVEIKDGLVIPEFGVVASLVLGISLFTMIMISSKSKISILSRY